MKKFTILTIAFALVCALAFGISVNAADNSAYKAGDTVTVKFSLGDTMRNGDYTINYNSDALTFVNVTPANSKNDDPEAGKVVVSFNSAEATEVDATFTAKATTEDVSAQVSLVPEKFRNTSGNLVDVQTASKSVTVSAQPDVENETVENNVVENEVTKNEVVKNETVVNDTVENDVVENNVVENEVDTPSTTNTVKNDDDDKKTYDQTGANIAIVAVIALAVVLGSAIVIKRK